MSGYDEFGRDDHLGDPSDPGAEPEPAMSTQQGDVEAIREALETTSTGHAYEPYTAALAALDRLTAALQRAEQEIAYTRDRGDSVVYHHEREAFDEWLRKGTA